MKKILSLFLCMLLLASVLSACNTQTPPVPADTVQTESEATTDGTTQTESDTQPVPTIPPEQALPPEQVVQGLDANAVIMEIGTSTRQVLLYGNDWAEIQNAFTMAGYAPVDVTLLDNTKLETKMLYGKDFTVTLQKTQDGAYAIWEPYNPSTLSLLLPNEKTGKGEVTLAQIGIARVEEVDNPLNGMCYIYKLSDGSAVIIDGGFNNKECRNNILNTLGKLDIAKTDQGKYRITAWIFSHGHKDHRAAFTGFGKNMGDQVELSYVMYNFPVSPGTLTTSTFDLVNFESKMAEYYPNAQHVVPHAGLAYHFDNLTVEVLYSPEMMYQPDKTIDYYNDTSLIMIADCSGARTLFMGDAGEKAATKAWENYNRAAFKANMLQITHHGFNTGNESHNWKNIKQIYNSTDATIGLLPMTSRLEGNERNGRYTVIVGHGNASYQMSFFVNKRDRQNLSNVTQEDYMKFVDEVAAGTNKYPTLFGYDGINIIFGSSGIVTYIAGSETAPMVTLFSLGAQGASMTHNQLLADWLD